MLNNGKWWNGNDSGNTIDLRFQNPFDVRDNADGGGGNDTIYGNTADNVLQGGSGNDIVYGSWGDDHIFGGTGNDYLSGQEGNDLIYGDAGNDTLVGGSGNDALWGGADSDSLWGGDGQDHLYGGDGDDFLYGDQADAGGTDVTGQHDDWLDGGAGNDTLQGGIGFDTLFGGGGDDKLYGGGGDDWLQDSFGNNTLRGGDGDDWIWASGSGDNYISGDAGNDIIGVSSAQLSNPDTIIQGGSGVDTLELWAPGNTAATFNFGAYVDGIEHIQFESTSPRYVEDADAHEGINFQSTPETLNLSFRDVINASPTDKLVIDGTSVDTLNLSSFKFGDQLSGGQWDHGTQFHMQDPDEIVQAYDHYDYVVGGKVYASLDVDSDIHVNVSDSSLHLITPDHFLSF
jgi:Ca2+-binding RTX toxin-like protein